MPELRLRNPFPFPNDLTSNNEDSTPTVIDEQEQSTIITTISHTDALLTRFYARLFAVISLVVTVLHILTGRVSSVETPLMIVTGCVSVGSLGLMGEEAWGRLDVNISRPDEDGGAIHAIQKRQQEKESRQRTQLLSWISLNAMLVIGFMDVILGGPVLWRWWAGTESLDALVRGLSPIVLVLMTLLVRWQLRPVDVDALAKLKYNYKGA